MKPKLAALVTWNSTDLSRDQAVAVAPWKHAASVISAGQHQVAVLDEITYPINWGWLEGTAVVDAITSRPPSVNVVDAALINAVMTVTEAKTEALWEAGVPGTGTASDAVLVSCPPGGTEPYAGPRSRWGACLGRAVRAAVAEGTARYLAGRE